MKGKRGRNTKYTPEIVATIISYIEAGNYEKVAAQAAGIGKSTFKEWKAEKPDFAALLKDASAKAEARNVARINDASKKQWQAAAWYLERKHNERWGVKQKIEHSGSIANPIMDAWRKAHPDDED